MGNLGSVLDELLAADPTELPGPAPLSEITETRRQANRADGLYMRELVVADRSGATLVDSGSTQAWVQVTLHLTPQRAHRDVGLARDLADHMPHTLTALCDGTISLDHAQVVAGLHGLISNELFAAAEPHLVDAATWKNPRQLRKVIAHVLHTHRGDKAAQGDQSDYEARSLHAYTTIGEMGVGNFNLHPTGMELFQTAMNACTTHETGDTRTPAQRRADALLTWPSSRYAAGPCPRPAA